MNSPERCRSSYLPYSCFDFEDAPVLPTQVGPELRGKRLELPLPRFYDAALARCNAYKTRVTTTYGVQHFFGRETYDEAYPVYVLAGRPAYEAPDDPSSASLRDEFEKLKSAWIEKSETMSVVADMVMLPEYQRIMALGQPVLPLIIDSLRREGGHWFWALKHISGVDHAAGATTIKEAADRWINWYESSRQPCSQT